MKPTINFCLIILSLFLFFSCTVRKSLYKEGSNYVKYEYDKKDKYLTISGHVKLPEIRDKGDHSFLHVDFKYMPDLYGEVVRMNFFSATKGRCYKRNKTVKLYVDDQPVIYEGDLTYAAEWVVHKSFETEHTNQWGENLQVGLSKKELKQLANCDKLSIGYLGNMTQEDIPFNFDGANVLAIKKFYEAVNKYDEYYALYNE